MTDFYTASSDPATSSDLDSSVIRAEWTALALAFAKVAGYTGAANRVVHINAGGTGQTTTSGFTFDGTTFTAPALAVTNNSVLTGDLAVNGGDITSSAATFNLLNATVTALNLGGAATTIALGAATGALTLGPALVGSIATDAVSPTTGAFKTAGGMGVAKALWVGGLANIAGAATMQSTLAVTGNATLAAAVTAAQTATVADNTATTVYTLPNLQSTSTLFLVTVSITGQAVGPAAYSAFAIVTTLNTTAAITYQVDGTNMFITLSGLNIQARHTGSGLSQAVRVKALRIDG